MFIAYDVKNGNEYAKLCTSKRDGNKVVKEYKNLGRVLDKAKGIYKNRERGVYTYCLLTDSCCDAPADYSEPPKASKTESLILDFGDVYVFSEFVSKCGLSKAIYSLGYKNADTLDSMVAYYALCSMANCHAESWWEGSYARILYPKANLASQRISEFLNAIGNESTIQAFFKQYFKLLGEEGLDLSSVLIDSTGLPNSIRFPLTAVRNHHGDVSNEVRLIYVVQQHTGHPIYFRYCPGNVVDVTTLVRSIAELKAQGIDTKFAILDAGYYTGENARELFEAGISFIIRLKENLKVYKELIREHFDTLESRRNLVEYNGRYVYMKVVSILLEGHNAYACIGLDIERKSSEAQRVFRNAKDRRLKPEQVHNAIQKKGVFVIVSTRRIARDKILPLYYMRQQVERYLTSVKTTRK